MPRLAIALFTVILAAPLPARAQFLVGTPVLAAEADPRHRLHGYLGAKVMGLITASQKSAYETGFLSHFGGGVAFYAGVRLNPWVSLEGSWITSLHDEAWGDRYVDSVRLGVIYQMTFGVDVKLHLPSPRIVEPYLQAGLGAAILGTSYPDGSRYNEDRIFAKGLAMNGGFGLDIWIAPYLSMGGRVVYRGLALGETSFSIVGVKARTIVHGLSVDAGATIHF